MAQTLQFPNPQVAPSHIYVVEAPDGDQFITPYLLKALGYIGRKMGRPLGMITVGDAAQAGFKIKTLPKTEVAVW